jgi:hypothetical protein
MQKLANAADDAKQIIGEGLIDALVGLGEDKSVQNLATSMQNFATETANVIRGIGKLIEKIQALDDKLPDWLKFDAAMVPIIGAWYKIASAAGQLSAVQKSSDNQHLKSLNDQFKIIRKTSTVSTKLTADELKKLKAKQLQNAIDKANLALNKGSDVFDMDKIQIAAALTNQAEQLGKATSGAQILQIANDTARLNVKKSILALEDAIASRDESAIIKATAKLNEDLKILNALTGQKTQMTAIESILGGLKSKDLINQANLDEALRKIREMLALLAQVKTPTLTAASTTTATATATDTATKVITDTAVKIASETAAKVATDTALKIVQTDNGIKVLNNPRTTEQINKTTEEFGGVISVIGENGKEFTKLVDGMANVFQTMEDSGAFNALVNSFASGTIGSFGAGTFRAAEGGSLFNSGAVGSRDRDIVINVNTGIGDPNAIAEAISNVLREAQDRGTLTAV